MLKKSFIFVLVLVANIAYTQQSSPLEGTWVNQKMQSTTITFSGNKFTEETRLSDTFGLRGTYTYTDKTIVINLTEENNGDGWKTKRPPVNVTYSYSLSVNTLSISGYSSGETQTYRKQSSIVERTSNSSSFPSNLTGTWKRDNFNNTLTLTANTLKASNQSFAWNLTKVAGDLYTLSYQMINGNTITITIKLSNGNLVISGDSGDGQDNWNGVWKKSQPQQQTRQQPSPGENQNKLIALLVNPLIADTIGQFTLGEKVYTTKAILSIIDSQILNNMTYYLVRINDASARQPFYIVTSRKLNLLNLDYPNTIFEDLVLEYTGKEKYSLNGVPRETFVFKLSSMEAENQSVRLNSAEAYLSRGLEYYNKKDYNLAITEFSQAIRLNSNYAEAYINRGLAHSAKFDNDLAITDFTQAIRLEPNNAEAYSNRGDAYSNKEDYARAIADLDQAIKLDPNNAEAYSRRAIVYWAMGERAIFNPKVLLSNPNTGKTNYDHAIADFTQVIRLLPNNAKAYDDRGAVFAQRGNIYRDKSDYDRAIADFETALRLDPKIDKFSLELTKKWRDTDTFRTP